jgi:hypothetical protein
MPVTLKDVVEAVEFVSLGNIGEQSAFLCRCSGEIYSHSEIVGEPDELPADIEDDERYVKIPDKRELELGKALVLDFARQVLPDDFHDVQAIFSKRGAYARFKDLLGERGLLDQWYDFEAKATEEAVKAWCETNSIEVAD